MPLVPLTPFTSTTQDWMIIARPAAMRCGVVWWCVCVCVRACVRACVWVGVGVWVCWCDLSACMQNTVSRSPHLCCWQSSPSCCRPSPALCAHCLCCILQVLVKSLIQEGTHFLFGSTPVFAKAESEIANSAGRLLYHCCVGPDPIYELVRAACAMWVLPLYRMSGLHVLCGSCPYIV
jgi:hypothetical protein